METHDNVVILASRKKTQIIKPRELTANALLEAIGEVVNLNPTPSNNNQIGDMEAVLSPLQYYRRPAQQFVRDVHTNILKQFPNNANLSSYLFAHIAHELMVNIRECIQCNSTYRSQTENQVVRGIGFSLEDLQEYILAMSESNNPQPPHVA